MNAADRRIGPREVKKIHTAVHVLGMEEDTYRDLLESLFGVRTCKGLSFRQYLALLRDLEGKGFAPAGPAKPGRKSYPGRPPNMGDESRGPLLHKIEALLAEAKRPWSYADSIAARMFQVERVKWANAWQLQKIVAALMYDARRHGRA